MKMKMRPTPTAPAMNECHAHRVVTEGRRDVAHLAHAQFHLEGARLQTSGEVARLIEGVAALFAAADDGVAVRDGGVDAHLSVFLAVDVDVDGAVEVIGGELFEGFRTEGFRTRAVEAQRDDPLPVLSVIGDVCGLEVFLAFDGDLRVCGKGVAVVP